MQSVGKRRFVFGALALLLVLALLLTAAAFTADGVAEAAVLKQGRTGGKGREMQQKVKSGGYYDGACDGVFGSGERRAGEYF